MEQVFINGLGCISAQETFDSSQFLETIKEYADNVVFAADPNYKDFIPPAAARRMAKGIKMGIVASKMAMWEAGVENIDAIITGTGLGCARDSEKFVSAIINNGEQYVTPTAFIQSTHNTVAGQIALEIQCKGYNFTYVQASVSFESALLDALLQLQQQEAATVLVGGVDEIGDYTIELHKLIGHIKNHPVTPQGLLLSKTPGAVFGEGASFFVLSNSKSVYTYAEVLDVKTFNTLPEVQLENAVVAFLKDNQLTVGNIDAVVLGYNGDVEFDSYYEQLGDSLFTNTQQVYYKHLSGEYHTASSFGLWLAANMLRTGRIPDAVKLNNLVSGKLHTVLLYNQYRGENHSFTLLQSC